MNDLKFTIKCKTPQKCECVPKKSIFTRMSNKVSDIIAAWIATWTFILIYSGFMILWIILHVSGILSIDSMDFIKYNLFLSWAAGIQASIVLMASNRQSEKDRKKLLECLELDHEQLAVDKSNYSKLLEIMSKIEQLEEILNLMEQEQEQEQEQQERKNNENNKN